MKISYIYIQMVVKGFLDQGSINGDWGQLQNNWNWFLMTGTNHWSAFTADKGKSGLRSEAAQNDFTILCLEMDI